VQVCK